MASRNYSPAGSNRSSAPAQIPASSSTTSSSGDPYHILTSTTINPYTSAMGETPPPAAPIINPAGQSGNASAGTTTTLPTLPGSQLTYTAPTAPAQTTTPTAPGTIPTFGSTDAVPVTSQSDIQYPIVDRPIGTNSSVPVKPTVVPPTPTPNATPTAPPPPPGAAGNQPGFDLDSFYKDLMGQADKTWQNQQGMLQSQMSAYERRGAATGGAMGFSPGGGNSMGDARQAFISGQQVYNQAANDNAKNRQNLMIDYMGKANSNDQAQKGRDWADYMRRAGAADNLTQYNAEHPAPTTNPDGSPISQPTSTGPAIPDANGKVGLATQGASVTHTANGGDVTLPNGKHVSIDTATWDGMNRQVEALLRHNLTEDQQQEVAMYMMFVFDRNKGKYPSATEVRDRISNLFGAA